MPESAEDFYARVANDLRMPLIGEWETFPFDGEMRPRALRPPLENEAPRNGAGGVDCHSCAAPDTEYMWTTDRWRLRAFPKPTGLPLIVLLEPRDHFGDPGDLPDGLASELGVVLARVERAMRRIDGVGRVHVCRWGDGSEHLHWWFMARPARFPQLIGSFAAIWDDILPPVPEAIWRDNLAIVVRELATSTSSLNKS
jgi:diadenosine tetraphosphate (Ap4A) HIT family hydrolase